MSVHTIRPRNRSPHVPYTLQLSRADRLQRASDRYARLQNSRQERLEVEIKKVEAAVRALRATIEAEEREEERDASSERHAD